MHTTHASFLREPGGGAHPLRPARRSIYRWEICCRCVEISLAQANFQFFITIRIFQKTETNVFNRICVVVMRRSKTDIYNCIEKYQCHAFYFKLGNKGRMFGYYVGMKLDHSDLNFLLFNLPCLHVDCTKPLR